MYKTLNSTHTHTHAELEKLDSVKLQDIIPIYKKFSCSSVYNLLSVKRIKCVEISLTRRLKTCTLKTKNIAEKKKIKDEMNVDI